MADHREVGLVEPGLLVQGAVGVREGLGDGPEAQKLFGGKLRDVAGAADGAPEARERGRHVLPLDHLAQEVHQAVPGGLWPDVAASVRHPLAGEHAAVKAAHDPLVLAEHVTDLLPAHSDVSRGDVHGGTHVPVQLGHEGLAEPHDLAVRLSLGVEVGATLAGAQRQPRESVLEGLLEGQELEDGQVDGGVEPEAALVRAASLVHLHPEAAVHALPPVVVDPRNPEDDHPLGLHHPPEGLHALGVVPQQRSHALQGLRHRLQELGLVRVLVEHRGELHLPRRRQHAELRRAIVYHRLVQVRVEEPRAPQVGWLLRDIRRDAATLPTRHHPPGSRGPAP
mmetsp:Transcript_9948/g.30293  ORF Transcript_9948/g.30293 Transcript_9948/m.30293 type:complete len:338 (-) Transcript_9948:224-1237(-)